MNFIMYTTRANYKKMKNALNSLCDYMQEKFNDINNKYDELKAAFSSETIEKFKEILKEEISKINDKLDVKRNPNFQDILN